MKRIFALLVAAIMTLALLAGCSAAMDKPQTTATTGGGKAGTAASIMDVLDEDMRLIYENRDTALPAAVIYIYQGEGERVESPLYGEENVNAVLDAIAEITITGETDKTVADNDSSFTFISAEGTEAGSVSFNGEYLDCGDKKYEIEGKDTLADIDFPAKSSRDTLALDGPDPKLAEFLERCKTEEPVSVKVARDGSEREITNAETIENAVNSLYSVNLVMFAFQGAEEPSTKLTATFIMQDGEEYSLTFYDDYYIFEYPQPLGIWSFCIDGAGFFIEVLEGVK